MSANPSPRNGGSSLSAAGGLLRRFVFRHGAPFVVAGLLLYLLWSEHAPDLATPEQALRHGAWVGLGALAYLALQIRAVLALPRTSVLHPMIEVIVSLLPLIVVLYAGLDWARGAKTPSVFQVIVMQQATMAVLIDVILFTWVSMRLSQHSLPFSVQGR